MMNRICVSPILLLIVLTVSLNAQPKAGDWKVPTRFGQFVFSVNSGGTQIIKLATTFSNYAFGGITQNGTVSSQPSPGWPISNSQFSFTNSINPSGTIRLTLNGTFTPAGDQASGTWSMLVSGQTDSDVWSSDTSMSGATARWIQTNGTYGGQVYSFAVSGTNLYAGTYGGGVFLTTNNGTSWSTVNTGLANTRVQALALSGTNLFAGTNSGVFRSTNNGTNWTQTGLTNTAVTSFALSGTNLFAGTIVGVFLSTNNGTTWTAVNTGLTDTNIWSLAISGANLFAGTFNGAVWRRPLAEMVTSMERFSTDLPTHFTLDQNYPNPFNPSTKIQFSTPSTSFVSLKVFNILGAEIASLVNENRQPGTYQVTWDANGYPSGVYFYRLMSAGKVFTGKMNLLK